MLNTELLRELTVFIETHTLPSESMLCDANEICQDMVYSPRSIERNIQEDELKEFIDKRWKPPFQQVLFNFIDRKGVKDSDIYKKAGIDRRHFSKIRSNPDYRIGKNAAIALSLALELNKEETDTLLNAAGFTLSENDIADLVILFCLEKKIYNVLDVNQALAYFSKEPLTGTID